MSNNCPSPLAAAFTIPVDCTVIIASPEQLHQLAIWLPLFSPRVELSIGSNNGQSDFSAIQYARSVDHNEKGS